MAKIRLLHTSDWHLGKKLFQKERLEEQELFLNWLFTQLQTKQIDYLIIAGDIFDVPTPPNAALKLFFNFIYNIGKLPNLKTIIIGGNHDSSSLLEIPENFFLDVNCKIFTGLDKDISKHNFYDELRGIKLGFKTLPYFKNYQLINHLSQDSIIDEFKDQNNIESFFKNFFQTWEKDCDFKFLISHHSYGHSDMSGSEQAIYLSGVESFPLAWIKDHFDYVALGHIHKKLELSKEPPIIYPGSPIPLRFSESNQKTLVEITIENKEMKTQLIEIPNFRKLVQIKGSLNEVYESIKKIEPATKYELPPFVEIIVELEKPQAGLSSEFKQVLQKKNYELISYIPLFKSSTEYKNLKQNDLGLLSLSDIFKKYYEYKYENDHVPDEILKQFHALVEEIQHENP